MESSEHIANSAPTHVGNHGIFLLGDHTPRRRSDLQYDLVFHLNRNMHWLIFVAALLGLLGLVFIYRSMAGRELRIDPRAAEAIEKAKRR